jgi:hypothetical protein
MPGFMIVIQNEIWPTPNNTLLLVADINTPLQTLPAGQAGSFKFEIAGGKLINGSVGEEFRSITADNSFAIYSDTYGCFLVSIVEESATKWFKTQPIALERPGTIVVLSCFYENGILDIRANSQQLLQYGDANGQVCIIKDIFRPMIYTLGKTWHLVKNYT